MRGFIYILHSNERPGIVKIGKTTKSPKIRCNEHNRDWYLSINSWEVRFWRWIENCNVAETEIHKLFVKHNLGARGHREAFRVDVRVAEETAIRVCDKYPAKGDEPTAPILRKKKTLDRIAYAHIARNGMLTEKIIEYKKIMSELDFYKWLMEIKELL